MAVQSKENKEKTEKALKRHTKDPRKLVEKAIESIEEKLGSEQMKGSVGDLIRLLQLKKELQAEQQPKEIKVTWVEPSEKESASEK